MHLTEMLQTIEPQMARRLFDKAKQYHNVMTSLWVTRTLPLLRM